MQQRSVLALIKGPSPASLVGWEERVGCAGWGAVREGEGAVAKILKE